MKHFSLRWNFCILPVNVDFVTTIDFLSLTVRAPEFIGQIRWFFSIAINVQWQETFFDLNACALSDILACCSCHFFTISTRGSLQKGFLTDLIHVFECFLLQIVLTQMHSSSSNVFFWFKFMGLNYGYVINERVTGWMRLLRLTWCDQLNRETDETCQKLGAATWMKPFSNDNQHPSSGSPFASPVSEYLYGQIIFHIHTL